MESKVGANNGSTENTSGRRTPTDRATENDIDQSKNEIADEEKILNHEALLKSVFTEVKNARDHFTNFIYLFAFLIFVGIYMAILFLQAESFVANEVASSHSVLLPSGYASNTENSIESLEEVYKWLNNSIVQTVWAAPACGDGFCESPVETPAYGPNNSFGCASDCGVFANTTNFVLQISTQFNSSSDQQGSTWNLCMTFPMAFCWFNTPQGFSEELLTRNSLTKLSLPDGNWTFSTTAPAGSIEAFFFLESSYNKTAANGGNDYLWVVSGTICAPSSTSFIGICRESCKIGASCVHQKCPNLSSRELTASFIQCNEQCALGTVNSNFSHQTCDKIYDSWVSQGNKDCRNLSATVTSMAIAASTAEVASSIPRAMYQRTLWEKLGPSDSERLFNLGVAVQRCLYTMIKDECLVKQPKTLSLIPAYTAFFCTFFGGPTNLTGCIYNSTRTNTQLTTDQQLLTEMLQIHIAILIARDQQNRFTTLFVWALQSVYLLSDSTVSSFFTRLQELNGITSHNSERINNCAEADASVAVTLSGTEPTPVEHIGVGGVIKWVWEDDSSHGISLKDLPKPNEGFGSKTSTLSRSTLCTMDNVGSLGITSDPTPCNLVSPNSEQPYPFSYSYFFGSSGLNGSYFEDGVIWNTNFFGNVIVNSTAAVSSLNCSYDLVANGHCDVACNNPDFLFDWGDCTCPKNSFGERVCTCPKGQIIGPEGYCCDPDPASASLHEFTVSKYTGSNRDFSATNAEIFPSAPVTFSRNVENVNQVVIGLLLEQERRESSPCNASTTRFNFLSEVCFGGESSSPFGTAPQTLLLSSLYDANYVEAANGIFQQNSSFSNESFLFNRNRVPFAFYSAVLPGKGEIGFKYIFDANLSNAEATKLIDFMKEGFFLDDFTSKLDARLVTFNVESNLFTLFHTEVTLTAGGELKVEADVKSLNVEHYNFARASNRFRFALEIVFLIGLAIDILSEVNEFLEYGDGYHGRFSLQYFKSAWNVIDLLSAGIMVTGVVMWINNVVSLESKFNVASSYSLYQSPLDSFNYWKLSDNSSFSSALQVFSSLNAMSDFRGYYFSIQGINMGLILLRTLKLLSFHPGMGLITRTFIYAAPDVFHFAIILGFVLVTYALYGYIVFGRLAEQFQTLRVSLNSCFLILTGGFETSDYLFRLRGWEYIAAVVFWWSYVLVVFYVVMNLLIAIMVESFKGRRKEDLYLKGSQIVLHDLIGIARNIKKRILPGRFSRDEQVKEMKDLLAIPHLEESEMDGNAKKPSMEILLPNGPVGKEELCRLLRKFTAKDEDFDQLASDIINEVTTHTTPLLEVDVYEEMEDLKKSMEEFIEKWGKKHQMAFRNQ